MLGRAPLLGLDFHVGEEGVLLLILEKMCDSGAGDVDYDGDQGRLPGERPATAVSAGLDPR